MNLFSQRLPRRDGPDLLGRLAALEDYVEYLRQQGEYGFFQMDRDRQAEPDKTRRSEQQRTCR